MEGRNRHQGSVTKTTVSTSDLNPNVISNLFIRTPNRQSLFLHVGEERIPSKVRGLHTENPVLAIGRHFLYLGSPNYIVVVQCISPQSRLRTSFPPSRLSFRLT